GGPRSCPRRVGQRRCGRHAALMPSCSISCLRPETAHDWSGSRLAAEPFVAHSVLLNLVPSARDRSRLVGFAPRGGAIRRSLRLHLMPAELVAKGGRDLHRVAILLP